MPTPLNEQTFWDHADRRESGCWHWRGHDIGYQTIKWDGRTRGVHRVAYELSKGPIPEGLVVRHMCDNPPCMNPDHLLVGTRKDDRQDQIARNRRVLADPYLRLRAAAFRLGITAATLRQQIKAGKLEAVKLDEWHVRKSELERYRATSLGKRGRRAKEKG